MVTTSMALLWMTHLVSPGTPCRGGSKVVPGPIAAAITAAANDDEDPLSAAAYLTSIGYHESGFCADAVSKPDDPTWSYGPWQLSEIWLPPLPVPLRWQAELALELVRDSLARCGDLTMYVSGHCGGAPGVAEKRAAMARKLRDGTFPGIYKEPAVPLLPKHAPEQPAASGAEPALPDVPTDMRVRRTDYWSAL